MDSVGQEPERAQRNRLALFLCVWDLAWEDLEARSSERAGRTGLPARAPTYGAPHWDCFLTLWQVQGGQISYVGIGTLHTSVPTHTGWELQLLLWPSLRDLASSFILHSGGYIQGTSHSFSEEKSMGHGRCCWDHLWKYYLPKSQSQMKSLAVSQACPYSPTSCPLSPPV